MTSSRRLRRLWRGVRPWLVLVLLVGAVALGAAVVGWWWAAGIAVVLGLGWDDSHAMDTTHLDTTRGGTEAPPLITLSRLTRIRASGRVPQPQGASSMYASSSRPVKSSHGPDAARCTAIINRIMRAASGDARGVITDAQEARIAQLEQTNHELGELLSQALDTLELERVASAADLLKERAVSADLLERNGMLRAAGIETKAERITLRAENAQLRDRLGDYAGESWAHCPCCTAGMAVTDGEVQERVA